MRLAGGITVIVWSHDVNNLGLIIASIVLLNLGLIPLIVTINALTRLVYATLLHYLGHEKSNKFIIESLQVSQMMYGDCASSRFFALPFLPQSCF